MWAGCLLIRTAPAAENMKPATTFKQTPVIFAVISLRLFLLGYDNTANLSREKGDKDQELIQSSTTPYLVYHMGKWQITIKHHKQEPIGQQMTIRQQWTDAKAINNKNDPQKKYRLGMLKNT